jgi:uncharacterized protein with von Willebrand factor type A (vWA) domain
MMTHSHRISTPGSIRCSDCGEELDAQADACPRCGSRNRTVHFIDNVRLEALEQIHLKKKRPGQPRAVQEVKAGDEIFHKTGERRRLVRVIDREQDRYYEHIEDSLGNVIRHVEEPLTQHRGRGYAKKKRHPSERSVPPAGQDLSIDSESSRERGAR